MKPSPATIAGINVLDAVDALGRLDIDTAPPGRERRARSRRAEQSRRPRARHQRWSSSSPRPSASGGDRFVGLHAAERAAHRGPLIYLPMSSPQFEDGLRLGARFSRAPSRYPSHHDRGGQSNEPPPCSIPAIRPFAASHHVMEYLLPGRLSRRATCHGDAHRLLEVRLRHADPVDACGAGLALSAVRCYSRNRTTVSSTRETNYAARPVALREPAHQGSAREVRDAGHSPHDARGPGRWRHAHGSWGGGRDPMPGWSRAVSG